jgi:hypothetical protein
LYDKVLWGERPTLAVPKTGMRLSMEARILAAIEDVETQMIDETAMDQS